jgi:hypothetical protein
MQPTDRSHPFKTNVKTVTSFVKDLAASELAEKNPLVRKAINSHFPDCLAIHPAHQENDKLGVDAWVERRRAVMTPIDVKLRARDYGHQYGRPLDVAVEISFGNGPGWALKQGSAEYVVVVATDTGRSAAFRADELRRALVMNQDAWTATYKTTTTLTAAFNGGADIPSQVVFVPVTVLAAACAQERRA